MPSPGSPSFGRRRICRKLPVGRRVVVIGGGMTAIDAAVQSKLLGAEEVTIVYRRGPEQMKASLWEQELAQTKGVKIMHWAKPLRLLVEDGKAIGARCESRAETTASSSAPARSFTLPADMVFKAIGQTFVPAPLDGAAARSSSTAGASRRRGAPHLDAGRLGRRRLRRAGGEDLTVAAAQDGKLAARESIHRALCESHEPKEQLMADLRTEFVGIKSPNPFWLASAPPTDKEYNVVRAFKEGWGGVVWKTLGEDPAIVNVNGPRYGAIHGPDRRLLGFNNIELITDRPLDVNLREIKQVKRDWPDRALVVSLMVPCEEENWAAILPRVEETGGDGVELNFGCPHGMSERGMGSAVGQVPEYIEMVARWCKAHTRMPVIVKLTPNITDIRRPARAAQKGGADAVSLINTINSITSVNLDTFSPEPSIDGKGTHGGYCGPAVKPIALSMVSEIARDKETRGLPISASAASPPGATRPSSWRSAPAPCRSAPRPWPTASRS